MRKPTAKIQTLLTIAASAALATLGCSGFGPDAVQTGVVSSMSERDARLWELTSQVPRSVTPCGYVHAVVVDAVAGRVLGDVQLQITTATGETSAVSSAIRHVTLVPRDTGLASLRVTRGNRVVAEYAHWHTFRADDGYQLVVVLSDVASRAYTMGMGCRRDPDRTDTTAMLW